MLIFLLSFVLGLLARLGMLTLRLLALIGLFILTVLLTPWILGR